MSKMLFEIGDHIKINKDGDIKYKPLSDYKLVESVDDKFTDDEEYANYLCDTFQADFIEPGHVKVGNPDGVRRLLLEGISKLISECGPMYYTMESIDSPEDIDDVEIIEEAINHIVHYDIKACNHVIAKYFNSKLSKYIETI